MKKTAVLFYCDFCGKNQHQVAQLVMGPNDIGICDGCVTLATTVIAKNSPAPDVQRQQQPIETRKD